MINNEINLDLGLEEKNEVAQTTIVENLSLNSNYCKENIDIEKLNIIIDNYNENMGLVKKINSYEKNNFQQSLTILKKYKTYVGQNINYRPCKSSPSGRLFSQFTSLQGLPKKIRHTISNEFYYDIDIKNCHPVILVWYCKKNNIKCDTIIHYIENRDFILKDLSKNFDVSKDIVKKNILSIMNGGSGCELKEYNIEPTWFYNYVDEINIIHNEISKLNPEFRKEVLESKGKNYYNINGCIVNKVLCYYENVILTDMRCFCFSKGVDVGAFCFDGLMISKNLFFKELNLIDFIKEMCLYINQKNVIDIEIVEKPMDDIIDLTGLKKKDCCDDEIVDNIEPPNTHYEIALYMVKKIKESGEIYYWEKNNRIYVYNNNLKIFEEKSFDIIMNYIPIYMKPLIENYGIILFDSQLKITKDEEKKYQEKIKLNYKLLQNIQATPFMSNVLKLIKTHIIPDDEFIEKNFNRVPFLFPISDNKVVNLKTLEIYERTKEHYFTFITDNIFKTDRPNKDWVYNYFKEILKTENKDFITSVLTWFGYCLTGENCVKRFPILSGDGDNGKSAFFNVIKSIIGKFGIIGNEKVFLKQKSQSVHTDEYLPLVNKRFAYLTEIDKNSSFNEKLIKSITGNDGDISLRGCGGSTVEVVIDCKLLCICNGDDIPDFIDKQGFTNRIMVIPFKNKFSRDSNKIIEINSMKNDIFTELCYYVKEYFYDNNMDINFSIEIENETNKLKDNKDTIKKFMDEKIEITDFNIKEDRIKKDTLYKMYIQYCLSNDLIQIKVSKTELYNSMENIYNLQIHRDREYKGIKFIPDDDILDDDMYNGIPM
jgi:P4 family phage/plasmid primase-like protien